MLRIFLHFFRFLQINIKKSKKVLKNFCFSLAIIITEENNEELNDFFDYMVNEAMESDKISFDVMNQLRHYISDQMRDEYLYDYWVPCRIWIAVFIDYSLATEEEWYKSCEDTKPTTLNTAFYNEYSEELSNKHLSLTGYSFLNFNYYHADENYTDEEPLSNILTDFYADYDVIKNFAELEYVTRIEVIYSYSFYEG